MTCNHVLEKIKIPSIYRYQCVKCNRRLKIANGILLDELRELQKRRIEKKQQEKRN